ncbi:Hypothetical predicted protein [Cloeon dipterum]|uniref:Uncharacterized protein n=1 Tax=Cloeon dipterum TaxID=197152 RepID=A0A8S1C7U3_9INSE|nr:Hypothetical predicted protein [Cloeon dipterum]
MELLYNLQRRSSGLGFRKNRDVCIPRLVNFKNDTHQRSVSFQENVEESECLVGRFCPFNQRGGLYAVADELGFVYFQKVAEKKKPELLENRINLHNNAIFDLQWFKSRSGEIYIVTASGDKTVKIANYARLEDQTILTEHQQSIRTLCTHPDQPGFLASSGRDGNIVIYDDRSPTYQVSNVIVNAHIEKCRTKGPVTVKAINKSVTALALRDPNTLISGGYTDGTIKVWDLRRTYLKNVAKQPLPLHVFNVGATVSSLSVTGSLLYASCSNHSIYCFNANTYNSNPVCKFVGHDTNSAYSSYMHASVSDCGHYLASGSFDGSIFLWSTQLDRSKTEQGEKYPQVHPVARLVGHEKEVTCVQFGTVTDQLMLLSLSDDKTHRIWRPTPVLDKTDEENPIEGKTEIIHHGFFASQGMRIVSEPPQVKCRLLRPFPSFVHEPESVIHQCSPRVRKCSTNWLTALSPQNASPGSSPASASRSRAKVKRSLSTDRKSAKRLKMSSPIKGYITIQPKAH